MQSFLTQDILTYNKKIIFNAGVEACLDYYKNENNFVPKIALLFSPFGLPFVPIEIIGTDINAIIKNFTYTKDRDNPGAICSFELTPSSEVIQSIVNIINKYSGNLYSKIWGELGVDLEDLFKVKTLCQVWINGYHLFTGTLRSCLRNSSVDNNGSEKSYSIIIDELGNEYNRSTLTLDSIQSDAMQLNIADSLTQSMGSVAINQGVPLSEAIKTLVNAFKTTSLTNSFSMSDGFPLSYRLITESAPLGAISNKSWATSLYANMNLFAMHSSGGGMQSVWSFLKSLIPNPWMEFYTESGGRTIVTDSTGSAGILFPGFNYIVARSVPYSNPLIGIVHPAHYTSLFQYDLSVMNMLLGGDFIIVTDEMISDKSLGFDCSDQCTLFHTRYESKSVGGGAMDVTDKGIPAIGPMNPTASGGIQTFGIVEMFQSIDVCNLLFNGASSDVSSRIAKTKLSTPQALSKTALSNLLATWFRNQSRFREGSITCRCLPYARPGMYCLYLPSLSGKKVDNIRDIGIYYINSISHSYALGNNSVDMQTTLNVIRGVPLPLTIAQTALLLFDFEILPPISGLYDGEYQLMNSLRQGLLNGIKG